MNKMQCFVFVGLGDGLGSGDDDGPALGDDRVGVLVAVVGVAPVGPGFALWLRAGCDCW
jgi:hypothetical protein